MVYIGEGFDAHFGAVVVGDGSFDAREMVVGVAVVVAVVVGCKGGGVVWACRTRCRGGVLDVVVVNYYWLLGLGDSADGVHDGGCIWSSLPIGEEGVKVEVSARTGPGPGHKAQHILQLKLIHNLDETRDHYLHIKIAH